MSVFTRDPNKQSWLSFISKFESISMLRKWTAKKRLDQLYNCLSETPLEYANRCEGQNNDAQLRAELAPRFDLGIPWWLLGRNYIPFVKSRMRGWRYFLQRDLSVCTDGFPQTNTIFLQHVVAKPFLEAPNIGMKS